MANISNLGSATGIDAESIITQLLALDRQPITTAQTSISNLNSKLSTWGKIQSTFSALKEAAGALAKDTLWDSTTAKSSDPDAMTVTTGTNTAPGSYSIQVNQLAKSQFVSTNAFASKSDVLGDGTLVIEFGTFKPNPDVPTETLFDPKAGSTAVSIEIGPEDTTLEKIRDKINASASGITASIVNDTSGARLVMKGPTGESNAFKVSVTEGGTAGLSALAYDPTTNINNDRLTQSASNAKVVLNGIAVSSDNNTLKDVVDGLTVQLNKTTTAAVDVTVSSDTAGIQTAIDTFIKAYNDTIGGIRVQTLYDEASKTAGPLQGDSTATGLLRQLRSMATSSTSASSVFDRLSSIGLEAQTDGSLKANSTKLNAALKNVSEMKKLFATINETDTSAEGLGVRLQKLSSQIVGSDGSISTRTTGIKSNIKRSQDQIAQMELRVSATEKRLRAQYTALDQTSAKLANLSSYMTAQLKALSTTTSTK